MPRFFSRARSDVETIERSTAVRGARRDDDDDDADGDVQRDANKVTREFSRVRDDRGRCARDDGRRRWTTTTTTTTYGVRSARVDDGDDDDVYAWVD